MSQVLYLFRKPSPRAFSIETVFEQVIAHLPRDVRVSRFYCPNARGIWGRVVNLRRAFHDRAPINHITGEVHYLALALPAKRTVLTVHDCRYEFEPSRLKRFLLLALWFHLPVRRAAIVTVISEKVRCDLSALTGRPSSRIVVIPDPVPSDLSYTYKPFDAARPRILHIGTAPNKNLTRVLKSLAGIPCVLDIVGLLSAEDAGIVRDLKLDVVNTVSISRAEIVRKYAECDIVSFPSTYEGFGLPIVEGQAVGRPVLTSNVSPMNEIAASAACVIDPTDISSIREGFLRIIQDADYRRSLIEKGRESVRRFDPAAIARSYADLYRRLEQGLPN